MTVQPTIDINRWYNRFSVYCQWPMTLVSCIRWCFENNKIGAATHFTISIHFYQQVKTFGSISVDFLNTKHNTWLSLYLVGCDPWCCERNFCSFVYFSEYQKKYYENCSKCYQSIKLIESYKIFVVYHFKFH